MLAGIAFLMDSTYTLAILALFNQSRVISADILAS
jgi:hypothetical protein